MSLATLMVRAVDILAPGWRTDGYGDEIQDDWTNPITVSVSGWVAWSSSFEVLDGRDAVATNLSLTLPAGTVITAMNRVRLDGQDDLYELDGEPMSAWTPRGEHHIECMLKRVLG